MKASWKLFGGLSVFYVIMTVIYWQVGGEEVGIAGMLLSACLAGMVGFYSPHSWWPLPVAVSACVFALGLIIGWWLSLIGLGALVISIIGMVTEYEKPEIASAH
jgi:hypothetical protein